MLKMVQIQADRRLHYQLIVSQMIIHLGRQSVSTLVCCHIMDSLLIAATLFSGFLVL